MTCKGPSRGGVRVPMPKLGRVLVALFVVVGLGLGLPAVARAFCGFYVSGAEGKLFNEATMVVLMRDGRRTVLSMSNDYSGPLEDFAMVVPVPHVLDKPDVKTLPAEIFTRVDQLASPRLVEYWEQDPCPPQSPVHGPPPSPTSADSAVSVRGGVARRSRDLGVKVEAQFDVGEYEIVILSAQDSQGLETWLRQNRYRIPDGAAEVLRPYVQMGMKFFVAKVNIDKAVVEDGRARLSPLRFHFDSDAFMLPIRLGLLNSKGTQDVIVHIVARGVRYEVSNYDNYAIPTNLEVSNETRDNFAAFYAKLFDAVVADHPGAVITEYAWGAGSCDPCPTSTLSTAELATLGANVIPSYERALRRRVDSKLAMTMPGDFVLTRLHVRYTKQSAKEDLRFRPAPAIVGGREFLDEGGVLEQGAYPSPGGEVNNFQARYIIRHPWTGPIACETPQRGVWGGPPAGVEAPGPGLEVAADIAFSRPTSDVSLASFVAEDATRRSDQLPSGPVQVPPPTPVRARTGCACRVAGSEAGALPWLLGLVVVGRRRRRVRGSDRPGRRQ